MAQVYELQGDYTRNTAAATLAALKLVDPTGKAFKGAGAAGDMARHTAEALRMGAGLKKLDSLVGQSITVPPVTVLGRNDGLLGEQLVRQVSQEMGIEFKVLQNNSRHGVDLYGYDPVNNRYVVVEVKSSATGSFGQPFAGGPEAFLTTRAQSAANGQGWRDPRNTPPGIRSVGETVLLDMQEHGATTIGYKFEVALPQPNQSGASPRLTVKPWTP